MSDERDTSVRTEFDQTNGVVEGLEGESDGSAEGELTSRGDRTDFETVTDTEGAEVGEAQERTGD